jgi:hypothetical protein
MPDGEEQAANEQPSAPGAAEAGGRGAFELDAGIATVSISYDVEVVRSLLRGLLDDLFEEERPAAPPDFILAPKDSAAGAIIEAKRRNVSLPDREYVDAAEFERDKERYADKALEIFRTEILHELRDLPWTYLAVSVAAAVAVLEKEGLLTTRQGGADLIDRVFERVAASFKDRVGARRRGRKRELTPAKEIGYTKIYYETLKQLQQVKDKLEELVKSGERDPVSAVRRFFKIEDVEDEQLERLRFEESASNVVHEVAAKRFRVTYGRYLKDAVKRRRP